MSRSIPPLSPHTCLSTPKAFKITGAEHIRFHNLHLIFAITALEHGIDGKTLSVIISHVSSRTTLNIYAHITDEMQRTSAAKIDLMIGKVEPSPAPSHPSFPTPSSFQPYKGQRRKSDTRCVIQINDHL